MNKIIVKRLVKYILIFLVISIVIYSYYVPNTLENKEKSDVKFLQCPQEGNFTDYWNAWSYEYLTNNPAADINIQMSAWNTMMANNECGSEWQNPLDSLIEQHGASGTPVYWYDTTR
jgi:hypothetical protein